MRRTPLILALVAVVGVFSVVNYFGSKSGIYYNFERGHSVEYQTSSTTRAVEECNRNLRVEAGPASPPSPPSPPSPSSFPPPPDKCTPEEAAYQASHFCEIYEGRHNLKHFFSLVRFHLPDARLLIDIGANKGLVSSRLIELYRPDLGVTPRNYALDFITPWMKSHFANDSSILKTMAVCGITSMCDQPDLAEQKFLTEYSPVRPYKTKFQQALEVHSFEPSGLLYGMHMDYKPSTPEVAQIWHWHNEPVSNVMEKVFFSQKWDESGVIKSKSDEAPNTQSVTLDHLGDTLFANRTLDVIKIDAENVDALVVVGASNLLKQQRVRVIMWETPTTFPVPFPEVLGGPAANYEELTDQMNQHAGMTCYFPGMNHRTVRISPGCWAGSLDQATLCKNNYCPKPNGCSIDHSNIVCVSRTLAPSLYQAMETLALLHDE